MKLDRWRSSDGPRPRARAGRAAGAVRRPARSRARPASRRGCSSFADELRSEGMQVGTSELLDAFDALGAGQLDRAGGLPRGAGRDARQVAGGPARVRAPVRPLLLPRGRARGGRAWAHARSASRAASGSTSTTCARRSQARSAQGSDGEMRDLARLAVAAFGAPGRGLRRDRRGRAAHPAHARAAGAGRRSRATCRTPTPCPRDRLREFERHLRRELERALIERTESLPPAQPLREFDRALPSGPLQDLAQVHRVVAQLKRRLATQGHEMRGRRAQPGRGRAPHDARLARDRRRAAAPALPARSGRGGPRSTCSATCRRRSPARASSSCRCCTRSTTRSASCASFVFVERIDEVTEIFERERSFKAVSQRDRDRGRRRRRVRLHRLRARLARVPRAAWSTTSTRARP